MPVTRTANIQAKPSILSVKLSPRLGSHSISARSTALAAITG